MGVRFSFSWQLCRFVSKSSETYPFLDHSSAKQIAACLTNSFVVQPSLCRSAALAFCGRDSTRLALRLTRDCRTRRMMITILKPIST
eukprot:1959540-Pleurochrysis_carterae.AAC.1